MLGQLYAIYDLKTQVFYPPMVAATDEHAQRQIRMVLKRGGEMSEFPADYELLRIGTWADEQGLVTATVPPVLICRLDSLMAPSEPVGQRGMNFADRTAPPHGDGRGGPKAVRIFGPAGRKCRERRASGVCWHAVCFSGPPHGFLLASCRGGAAHEAYRALLRRGTAGRIFVDMLVSLWYVSFVVS